MPKPTYDPQFPIVFTEDEARALGWPVDFQYSPSQISTFETCNRKWAADKLIRLPRSDSTATVFGSAVHAHLEAYLKDGTIPPDDPRSPPPADTVHPDLAKWYAWKKRERLVLCAGTHARATLHQIPLPGVCEVEERRTFYTPAGRVVMLIDFFVPDQAAAGKDALGKSIGGAFAEDEAPPARPLVGDHKTTSQKRYVKTEADLTGTDPQPGLYGSWAMARCPDADGADLRWSYVIKNSKNRPKAAYTACHVSRDHLAARFAELLDTANAMREHAERHAETPVILDDLPGDIGACSAYGGCEYFDKCGARGVRKFPGLFGTPEDGPTPSDEELHVHTPETIEDLMTFNNPFGAPQIIDENAPAADTAVKGAAAAASDDSLDLTSMFVLDEGTPAEQVVSEEAPEQAPAPTPEAEAPAGLPDVPEGKDAAKTKKALAGFNPGKAPPMKKAPAPAADAQKDDTAEWEEALADVEAPAQEAAPAPQPTETTAPAPTKKKRRSVKELQAQLDAERAAHEETKREHEARYEELKTQLANEIKDHVATSRDLADVQKTLSEEEDAHSETLAEVRALRAGQATAPQSAPAPAAEAAENGSPVAAVGENLRAAGLAAATCGQMRIASRIFDLCADWLGQ